jgi:hypothetical protein
MVTAPVEANGPTQGESTGSTASLGVRAILDAARGTTRSDPTLWLLGALSFCLRGGIVLLLLPIVWVPTPVLLSIFLAPYLTSSGPSASAIPVLAASGVVAMGLVVAAIAVAALADVAAFERVSTNPATAEVRGGRTAFRLEGRRRAAAALGLISLTLIALVPIVAALVPLSMRVIAAATSELELPTQVDVPFVVTVLGRTAPGVILFIGIVLVVDLFVSLASRELLAARYGFRAGDSRVGPLSSLALGTARLARRPARTIVIWLLTWLITVAGVVAAVAALTVSWNLVREVLFSGVDDSPSGVLWGIGARLVAVGLLGAIWIGGVTLCGIASSLRGALWTIQSLDRAVADSRQTARTTIGC